MDATTEIAGCFFAEVLRIPQRPAARRRLALTGPLGAVRTRLDQRQEAVNLVRAHMDRLATLHRLKGFLSGHAFILPQVGDCQVGPTRRYSWLRDGHPAEGVLVPTIMLTV